MQDSHSVAVSNQRSAVSRTHSRPRLFPLTSDLRPRASRRVAAFTLTELLIVIAIIAVLASLTAAAAINALRASKRNGIVLEIKNVSAAIENFKVDYGAYPPNAMNPDPRNNPPAGSPTALAQADFVRMFKKAFPRHQESQSLMLAMCGQNLSGATGYNLLNGMTPTEALVFWLGGFSSDEQFPISGPGGPSYISGESEILEDRNVRYEFDKTLLKPGRELRYLVDLNNDNDTNDPGEDRTLNLRQFIPKGSEQPLAYFDTSRHKPMKYDVGFTPGGSTNVVYALKKGREGFSGMLTKADLTFIDPKFQVVHCGLDGEWGSYGASTSDLATNVQQLAIFPSGPNTNPSWVFVGAIADNLSNFTDGALADASEEAEE